MSRPDDGADKRSGPPTFFPNKVRTPAAVQLTATGHGSVADNQARLTVALGGRLSRSDYFEALEHTFGAKLTARDIRKASTKVAA